jgi:hypothetical protein
MLVPRDTTLRCPAASAGWSAEHDEPLAAVSHTLKLAHVFAEPQNTSTLSAVEPP